VVDGGFVAVLDLMSDHGAGGYAGPGGEKAGRAQYTDEKAVHFAIVALRGKVSAVADASLGKDEAVALMRVGGQTNKVNVPHVSGTAANPMTDEGIRGKFLAAFGDVSMRSQNLSPAVQDLQRIEDVRTLLQG
jgi:hypothetical protein